MLVGKQLGRLHCRCEDNIQTDSKKVECDGVCCIQLVQDNISDRRL
jgi:hypothetical protein